MSKVSPDLSSVTVVGLDLAKHVFQVHCLDDAGKVLLNRDCGGDCGATCNNPQTCHAGMGRTMNGATCNNPQFSYRRDA